MNDLTNRRNFLLQIAATGGAAGLTQLSGCAAPARPGTAAPLLPRADIAAMAGAMGARREMSLRLTEQALAAAASPTGEGARAFTALHAAQARATAGAIDARRSNGEPLPSLAGVPIAIDDMLDEAGSTTFGGATTPRAQVPAVRDAAVVRRLRDAGLVIVGRTSVAGFGLDALGVRPGNATPRNSFDRAASRIPGGASGGAAVAVADGMAAAAVGLDTAGALRIPAALNGLVAFRPTQSRVSLEGSVPVAPRFDTVGSIGRTVDDCVLLDEVLTSTRLSINAGPQLLYSLRLLVPTTLVLDDLSFDVLNAFETAVARLAAAGATIVRLPVPALAQVTQLDPAMLTAIMAYGWHQPNIAGVGATRYDARTLARLRAAGAVPPPAIVQRIALRDALITSMRATLTGIDAMLMPTIADTAPTMAEVTANDAAYARAEARMQRNAAVVDVLGGCALTLPCQAPGKAPVGLTIAGMADADARVLSIGRSAQALVTVAG